MRASVRMSSERCSSPVRTLAPDRLPFTGSRGLSTPIRICGTSSLPSSVSTTTPVGAGECAAPLGDHPHDRARVEPRRGHRLLHLDHRLEQLGVEPHLLLGQLALGDVVLGAEIADLAALVVAERLPRAGAPADLPGPRDQPVLLVAQRAAFGQPLPFGQQGGAVVGVDVLQELLVADVLGDVAGEPLEGGVHEGESQVHVVGDHAFAHGGRDRPELAAHALLGRLRPAPPASGRPRGDAEGECQDDRTREDPENGGWRAREQIRKGRDHGRPLGRLRMAAPARLMTCVPKI